MSEHAARYADDAHRYRLDSRIATGGMGEVWRATDTALDRQVAVKLLKTEYADDPTFRERFMVEARHAAALHHPGVAAVYDYGEATTAGLTDGSGIPRPYLVMELVEGETLATLLRQGHDQHRSLDPDVVRELMAQAADAVGAAHKAGIIHRDIKPANLMVTPQGKVKITDFGIARAADGVGFTQTGSVMGTPQYLSPEQAEGRQVSSRTDVYALGVVTWECLAGRRPFDAESPVATALAHVREPIPELPASVPADLAAVVHRAMAKNPDDRFADGAAYATALRDPAAAVGAAPVPVAEESNTQVLPATSVLAAGAAPAAAEEPPAQEPDDEPKKKSPWPVILIVLLLVLLAAGVVFALTRGDGGDEPTDDPTSSSAKPNKPKKSSDAPVTVDVDESKYLGRYYEDVIAELQNLGLRVDRDEESNPGDEKEGDVLAVSPNGTLEKGDDVTVRYWGPQPEEPSTPPEETEPTEEQSPSEEETTESPSESTSPSETASTEGGDSDTAGELSGQPGVDAGETVQLIEQEGDQ